MLIASPLCCCSTGLSEREFQSDLQSFLKTAGELKKYKIFKKKKIK